MAGLNDILNMCKAGQITEAYNLAKADLEAGKPWAVLTTSRALYYLIKNDAETGAYKLLIEHLHELYSVNPEEITNEHLIFWIGYCAKKYLNPTDNFAERYVYEVFYFLRPTTFNPSLGYSVLLEGFIKFEAWVQLADFIDWWNLDNLRTEDYEPVRLPNGRSIISLAERAYIAMAKALLRLNDPDRIREFLPKMDALMENHPKYIYPGYFYGKLLLKLGSSAEEELRVILPFARKKASEFWVWQLLSDVFINDREKQLACLLRAAHCNTEEKFLCKVRIKLAHVYAALGDYNRARHHIDVATRTYATNGWPMPNELVNLIHSTWIDGTTPDDSDSIDYQNISDNILYEGFEEAVAVVTFVDPNSNKSTLIYGKEKRMVQKLRFKVGPGAVVKIKFFTEDDGKIRVLNATKMTLPRDLDFAKVVEGSVKKRDEWTFAFLYYEEREKTFINPNTANKYNVVDGEEVKALIVYDYERRKEKWSWTCISIKR